MGCHLKLLLLALTLPLLLVQEVALLVVVRGNLQEPVTFDLDEFPHELFSCEDKLIVYEPARQRLKEARTRMHVHCVLVLKGAIGASLLLQLGGVVEEASRDGLSDIGGHVVLENGELLVGIVDLHSLTKLYQLILDVSGSLHRAHLHKVL